jgi:hypothetical protein
MTTRSRSKSRSRSRSKSRSRSRSIKKLDYEDNFCHNLDLLFHEIMATKYPYTKRVPDGLVDVRNDLTGKMMKRIKYKDVTEDINLIQLLSENIFYGEPIESTTDEYKESIIEIYKKIQDFIKFRIFHIDSKFKDVSLLPLKEENKTGYHILVVHNYARPATSTQPGLKPILKILYGNVSRTNEGFKVKGNYLLNSDENTKEYYIHNPNHFTLEKCPKETFTFSRNHNIFEIYKFDTHANFFIFRNDNVPDDDDNSVVTDKEIENDELQQQFEEEIDDNIRGGKTRTKKNKNKKRKTHKKKH